MKPIVTVRPSDPLGRLMLPLDGTRYGAQKGRLWQIEEKEDGFLITPAHPCCALCGKEGDWPLTGRFPLCPDCLRELGLSQNT